MDDFLAETRDNMAMFGRDLIALEERPHDDALIAGLFRVLHSLKGTCGFLDLPRLEKIAHAGEALLDTFRRHHLPVTSQAISLMLILADSVTFIVDALARDKTEPPGNDDAVIARIDAFIHGNAIPPPPPGAAAQAMPAFSSIRVSVTVLDELMTLVSELVLARNQLEQEYMSPTFQRLAATVAELQECVMKTRMQPVFHLWQNMPRLLRDLSAELGKPVRLIMRGESTELDRHILEQLHDPLLHLIRNAVDHGIEPDETRSRVGKPEQATIILEAKHEGGYVVMSVTDDGRGLDMERIRERAVSSGLMTPDAAQRATPTQLHGVLFMPGFSTAAEVTHVSGRGVGLDVVRSNIEKLGGTVALQSAPGQGMAITLKMPLTLTIIPGLILQCREHRFVLPRRVIRELVRLPPLLDRLEGQVVMRWRERLIPVIDLADVLQLKTPCDDGPSHAAIVRTGSLIYALRVCRMFDTRDVVVRPLAPVTHVPVFSGQTIMGDGAVIFILDAGEIARSLATEWLDKHLADDGTDDSPQAFPEKASDPLLLFRIGNGKRKDAEKALKLSRVYRLEKIPHDAIRLSQDAARNIYVAPYEGGVITLVPLQKGTLPETQTHSVIVLEGGGPRIGLVVDAVTDILYENVALTPGRGKANILGRATIDGRVIDVLDAAFYSKAENAA